MGKGDKGICLLIKKAMSAGCLFYNDLYVLGGYQPRKQKPMVSGLGGKREGQEELLVTALRETIEELFEIPTVSGEWIGEIQKEVGTGMKIQNGDYSFYCYNFTELERFLQILQTKGVQSPLYDEFPIDISSLLLKRKAISPPPEISHLVLIPKLFYLKDTPFVSPYFLKDIRFFLKEENKEKEKNAS
jgi:hypothetical protein